MFRGITMPATGIHISIHSGHIFPQIGQSQASRFEIENVSSLLSNISVIQPKF